ncbi:MAG TPA: hypothetical protein GX015_02125 [Corynebacterium sp.]|uniref:hypothetical protein n=1 Tax=Corynebacterium sp. TaxID=1720 RepID=UPI001821E554|nr:hypothetical protein [Corynebacterium sp.]HHT31335.1 hypothetical protein [Corynebacterium sp.]
MGSIDAPDAADDLDDADDADDVEDIADLSNPGTVRAPREPNAGGGAVAVAKLVSHPDITLGDFPGPMGMEHGPAVRVGDTC